MCTWTYAEYIRHDHHCAYQYAEIQQIFINYCHCLSSLFFDDTLYKKFQQMHIYGHDRDERSPGSPSGSVALTASIVSEVPVPGVDAY